MRSKDTSADEHGLSFNNFFRGGSKFVFELCLWAFVFDYICAIVDYSFLWLRFYKVIKCIIGGFHIYRSSFWLIECRPVIPFIRTFRLKYLHVFRWLRDNFFNVESLDFFLTFLQSVVNLHHGLMSCFDITFRSVDIFISEPKCTLSVKETFSLPDLLLDLFPFFIGSTDESCKVFFIALDSVLTCNEALAPVMFLIFYVVLFNDTDCFVHFKGIVCCGHTDATGSDNDKVELLTHSKYLITNDSQIRI